MLKMILAGTVSSLVIEIVHKHTHVYETLFNIKVHQTFLFSSDFSQVVKPMDRKCPM